MAYVLPFILFTACCLLSMGLSLSAFKTVLCLVTICLFFRYRSYCLGFVETCTVVSLLSMSVSANELICSLKIPSLLFLFYGYATINSLVSCPCEQSFFHEGTLNLQECPKFSRNYFKETHGLAF